jgi:hypothetical protein
MSDSRKSLPARPSLVQPQKQAKELLQAWKAREAEALRRAQTFHGEEMKLADAQFVIAREHGFDSWAKLKRGVETIQAPGGLSSHPPLYRIDWDNRMLEPRQAMSATEWDRIADVMKDLRLTVLNASWFMTDDAMQRISKLGHVTSLRLGGANQLTDQGLKHLAQMPQLEELDLSNCPGGTITDRGLESLRNLVELRSFRMCWQNGISDDGAANLQACEKLVRVDLLGSPTGDGAIKALRGKRNLRQLKTGRLVTDRGLSMLQDFPVFRTWQAGKFSYDLMSFGDTDPNFLMVDGPFTDQGFASLAALEGLFGLGFFWHISNLTPKGLKPLSSLPHLGALGCEGKLCDDVAMRYIASIPNLRMLMAQGAVATDDGFSALSQSQTIEYIWGRKCPNLQGRGFVALSKMAALKGLAVSCQGVDDTSLSTLPQFPALKWLLPMDVPDAGFRHVGRCSELEKLTCMYCRDTGDVATEHIAGLSKLKHYNAGQTQITDHSLEILGGMNCLEEVELSKCAGISNAGLRHLAKLPKLRKVSVDASPTVTRDGISVFPSRVHVDFWT